MRGWVYPFPAIVGQERLRLALILVAVDPRIGGVLVQGGKGTAKSTAVRGLARLLPKVPAVAGCVFRCDPNRPDQLCDACRERLRREGSLPREEVPAPFVDLPLGATEDRVIGTLDLERALHEGRRHFEPGLLARAHRGILYVDEVNLLPDHLVDVLLDVAASGVNVVEREGVSFRHAASFVLVGTMNPEEGELRPQFLDRFGLSVEVGGLDDPALRAEAVRRRLAFERNPEGFLRQWAPAEEEERRRIAAARRRLAGMEADDALLRLIARLCLDLGVEGLRADLVLYKAAAALAAYRGRDRVSPEDVREVAPLVLRHRQRRQPFDRHEAAAEELQQVLDRHLPGRPRPREAGAPGDRHGPGEPGSLGEDDEGDGASDPASGGEPGEDPGHGQAPGPGQVARQEQAAVREDASRRVDPPGPTITPAAITLRWRRGRDLGGGRRAEVTAGARGYPTGTREIRAWENARAADLALAATLRAAAARGGVRAAAPGGAPLVRLARRDLRLWRRQARSGTCVLFVLDASGSMGVADRMRVTKAAVLALLADAYRRRDRVGLVICRGREAQLALPFTRSVEHARARLEALPTGGRTPLAAGLALAFELLARERRVHQGAPVLLIVVTDGKANVAREGGDPYAEAVAWARRIAGAGFPAVVADAGDPREPLSLAAELAAAMGAVRLTLDELENRRLIRILAAGAGG